MITPQAIFDAAWQRFIIEKRLPCIKDKQCAYEHNGNNCAIGAVMTQEQIRILKNKKDEALIVSEVFDKYPSWFSGGSRDAFEFLQYELHDKLADIDTGSWRYPFEERKKIYEQIADMNDLLVPK